jgi:hypothetical protein
VVTKVRGEEVAAVVLAPPVLHQLHCLPQSSSASSCVEADRGVVAVVLAPPVLHQRHCLPQNSNVSSCVEADHFD